MKALVMGGGMSGLALAINLLEQGIDVSLVESDSMFGGRASSWLDEDGDMIDNALHVFMPYYVNLLAFFRKMGIEQNIAWKAGEFYFQQPGGEAACLKFKRLPAPFHGIYAMAHLLKDFRPVPLWKLAIGGAGMGLGMGLSLPNMDAADAYSLETFMGKFGSLSALQKLMEPATNGLTFTRMYQVSAKVMMNWFLKMFVSSKNARIGFANGGLGEIWVETCTDYIKSKGGELTLNNGVAKINFDGENISSVELEDGTIVDDYDVYVSAMSPYALRRVLPDEAYNYNYFCQLQRFQYAPSLSLQVWFDKKLTDIDVTFFSNDRVYNTYADLSNVLPHVFKGGTMFEMVLSPTDHIEGLPDQVIYDQCIAGILEDFPTSQDAKVLKWKVVRERQGVYRPLPGMEEFRPYQRTPISNFYLTGDYTKTHVSSGGMEAAIHTANTCTELIVADKLKKNLDLNIEYMPYEILIQIARIGDPFLKAGAAAGLGYLALKGLKLFKQIRALKK